MTEENVEQTLRTLFGLKQPAPVDYRSLEVSDEESYTRELIEYDGDDRAPIPAYLFRPINPSGVGVVAYHQHNGEFHLGKSEIAGIAGDALQSLGPELARRGVTVLAPDAVTFEDRRGGPRGIDERESDWLQHFNGMAYRLQNGDLLMRKCLDDCQRAVSVLSRVGCVQTEQLGVAGHSFGGTLAMYHAALDQRCRFACVSGAVCSYEKRQRSATGIGMVEVVPGITQQCEVWDVVRAIQPRPLLIASSTEDKYSADASEVTRRAGSSEGTVHYRIEGPHALDENRYRTIIEWLTSQAA